MNTLNIEDPKSFFEQMCDLTNGYAKNLRDKQEREKEKDRKYKYIVNKAIKEIGDTKQ